MNLKNLQRIYKEFIGIIIHVFFAILQHRRNERGVHWIHVYCQGKSKKMELNLEG